MSEPKQIVIEDPRPFSDPSHPIHHPDDYALPEAKTALPSLTVDGLVIRQVDEWIIEVAGVLMSTDAIKQALTNPHSDRLYAFRREGDMFRIKSFGNANSANEFFEKGWIKEVRKY